MAPVKKLENMEDYLAALAANKDGVVCIKFFATWCRACKALDPKFRRAAIEYSRAGVTFYEMDWGTNRDLCKSLQIKRLPHIDLYFGKKGRVEQFTCGPSKAALLREKLDQYVTLPDAAGLSAAGVPEYTPVVYDASAPLPLPPLDGSAPPAKPEPEPRDL